MERITVDGDETTALRPIGATRIECGWCGQPTKPDRCGACSHVDPGAPWRHRATHPPVLVTASGRPSLDEHAIRRRYAEAKRNGATTIEQIAEALDRSPRTIREWRKRYDLR